MKIGNIIQSNIKGQIVIPKKIRDTLNITSDTSLNMLVRDQAIIIYPLKEQELTTHTDNSLALKTLRFTQGTFPKNEKLYSEIPENKQRELKESEQNKNL